MAKAEGAVQGRSAGLLACPAGGAPDILATSIQDLSVLLAAAGLCQTGHGSATTP